MAKYRITSIPQFSNGGINKPTQPTEYTVDPMYQTEPTQDENIDRLFSKIYAPQLESQNGLYETLQPEDCPPGYQPYKGECIDSKTLRELQWKEEDYNYEKELAQAKQIDELTSEEQSGERQQIFEDKFSRYVGNALKKGNKHEKTVPLF
jgi:isopropylmalate/homocitrate/citramalate synthase